MMNNININIIISFVEVMTLKDVEEIDIPNSTLYSFKADSRKLYKTKLENIIKIYNYIQKCKTEIIGIDIGAYHYLAASNMDFTMVYIDKSNGMYPMFQKYKNRMNHKQYDSVLAYSKLKTGLTNHINQVINELIEQINNYKTVFVLGEHNYSNLSFPSLIFDITYHALKTRMGEFDEIIIVDESYTSIECPKCLRRNRQNRTSSNHFKCKACGYYHENDDVVAASNIARRGYKTILV